MKKKINVLAIVSFYTIAISLRYLTNKTDLLESISSDFLKVLLQGIGPTTGAVVVFFIFRIKPVISLKGNYKNLLTPILLYWAVPIVMILGVEYFVKESLSFATVSSILIYGLLEETGWRGFLRQELKPIPELLNIFIVATLWFIWHLNFDFSSSNLLFFGILLLGSWGIGKIADCTHSLFSVAAFHSLNNFFPVMNVLKVIMLIALLLIWVIPIIIRTRQLKKISIS